MKASSLCFPIALTATPRRRLLERRRQLGRRAPDIDLGCTVFRAKIERAPRGGQLDIKNPSGRFYCAFRRDTNTKNATALEKERATAKPNARRMANGGARESEMSRTLARDGSWKERRA